MKTESSAKVPVPASEIFMRVSSLAPPFLDGYDASDISIILESATLRHFEANSLIAHQGHSADRLFLVLQGMARLFTTSPKGEKVLLLWIRPGDIAGARSLVSKPSDYLVNTETVEDSSILVWPRSAMLSLVKRYPGLLDNVLIITSDYLAIYRDLHLAARYNTARQRVARVLENLAKGIGEESVEGTLVRVRNEDLANTANVTIFTVSRLLSEWQRKGLLTKGRGTITISSKQAFNRTTTPSPAAGS